MNEDDIQQIIDTRGLDNILEDHDITLPFVLDIMDQLGYINLERYEEE